MAVTRNKVIVWCLLLAIIQQHSYSQVSKTKFAEPAAQSPKRQNESFVDYTLKRLNPTDKDYGECIDEGRRLLLNETIEKGYFWTNLLTIGLLLVFFLVVVFQWGLMKRRSLIYANALCQYQSVLARAEAHSGEATRRNHEFMEALRLATDPAARKLTESLVAVRVPFETVPSQVATAAKQRKSNDAPTTSPTPSAGDRAETGVVTPSAPVAQRVVLEPAAPGLDLIAQNNRLQQQLGLCQDQVKQLRRQLNESEKQLQAEKQKNRTLKGE